MSAGPGCAVAVLCLLLASADDAMVRVIDGDTLVIAGTRHRLIGIDAPEARQTCQKANLWKCGEAATQALQDIIAAKGGRVTCNSDKQDRYGRNLSLCFVGGVNLNAWMVRNGWAVAYRKYDRRFIGEENMARKQRLGLWSSSFVMPWVWRKR